jgi:aminoglycoside phosphotransferase (APT) family kinase protein
VHRDAITVPLVARLVAEQFPVWAELPVVPVAESGWDNRVGHRARASGHPSSGARR